MTDNPNDYSGIPLVKNDWPEWVREEGGVVGRKWRFEFEQPLPDRVSDSALGDDVLKVQIARGGSSHELVITTTTAENAWSDEVFFIATFRLFQRLEATFGRLKTIQGQARNMWRPFR